MRIAIVKLSALGDIVHAMVVLQFIKKFNNEISIDWVVEKSYKELLKYNPDIDHVHLINLREAKKKKSLLMFLSELNKVRKFAPYDIVIDLQGLIKSALIARLIPSKKTIGFDKFSSREGIASYFYSKTLNYGYGENVIERNIALIEFAIGFSVNKEQIQSKVSFLYPGANKLEIKLSSLMKNILIIPGASHLSKRYPTIKLAKLTALIDANFLVLWGNKNEKILAEEIKLLSPKVNICNKLKLDELILLISKVDLVIGPDTGPTHISWALNTPSITLFGPTPGYRNTYASAINRVIESESIVNPKNLDRDDLTIKNIDIKEIVKISKELLV